MTTTGPLPRTWQKRICLIGVLPALLSSTLLVRAQQPVAPAAPAQPAAAQPGANNQPTPAQTLGIAVEPSGEPVTLSYFNRPIVVLRAQIMGRSPDERRVIAVRAMDDLVARRQIGPVTATPAAGGMLIEVGGRVITGITPTDIDTLAGETLQGVTQLAVARVGQALAEADEARRVQVWARGGALTALAIAVAGLIVWGLGRIRRAVHARLSRLAERAVSRSGLAHQYSIQASGLLVTFQRRVMTFVVTVLQLFVLYSLLTFTLRRFPYTRPWGETLRESMLGTLGDLGLGVLHAVPSLFTVLVILIIARAVTLLLEPWFAAVERGAVNVSWMHAETAATTRRLVMAGVWLFAAAMAFPYVPGSDTDAFRGISVAVGLMFTLGSSGLVNQLMSGFVVTYSRALRLGDFVRIGDVEGTIIHVGMLSTKIRTLRSEEITMPNAVVVSQTTTDFSRYPDAVLTSTSITVGYSVPWRQVHALLRLAAERTAGIRKTPEPRVLQTGLEDMRVKYTLVFVLESQQARVVTLSALHAHIQDLFNEYNVQIVTPNYEADPPEPKLVPKSDWYAAPARRDPGDGASPSS
jgi:small-conductance mechanosensitive channel